MSNEIATKENENLSFAVEKAESILRKSYLANLQDSRVVETSYPVLSHQKDFYDKLNENVRFFDVTQIVLNKNENMRDKLVSVFNAVGNTGSSLLMQIKGEKEKVSVRIGIKNAKDTGTAQAVLENSLKGNFPGTLVHRLKTNDLQESIINDFSANQTVATVTDIAGLRSDEENKEKQFMQGMEKVIDAMQGKTYTLFLIADPVSLANLNANRHALEIIYSQLVPLSESTYTFGTNESQSLNVSVSKSVTHTISESIANSVSHTTGRSHTVTDGISHTVTTGTSDSKTKGVNINPGGIAGIIGFALGGPIGGMLGGALGSTLSFSSSRTHSVNNSESKGTTHSVSNSTNYSDTTGRTDTTGTSDATSETQQIGKGLQHGTNESSQIKFENHTVKKLMERIDKILERYDESSDLGMWNCAMYCIADKSTSQMCASIYRSVIRGKNSSLEDNAITVWSREQTPIIMEALRHMEHPFVNINGIQVTPGTLVSSAELAIQAGLPNHSVPGLPVLECAEFGRTVASYGEEKLGENYSVNLGKIYHMHSEESLAVKLNPDSLASHTFITGSTGSGKSNTVYKILGEAMRIGQKFLVVEPAKGEYKNVFGGNQNVKVFGTNPELTPLLRLNPFSFPHGNSDATKNIHILEHLDRLIEIFNVCWPMYAAMPAVLKEAVEKSYEDAGWNLAESTNPYGEDLYPTFADVARNVRTIIDSSEYDAENKGAYKGALVTRLKSLTNGINGLIFTTDEIGCKDLFDENVIVDLSRVGSAETKSLLMGLLVLKLQEYRMTSGQMNEPLKHITVLEEAHNLLKRTSTEQTSESGNLRGKSVEMLSNAIAEMRTYGEGFIIADQAPALLDMSVIRNTNTKIIMRLPDQSDRELVGKAANLNDDQITELAKLPCGVAAVYQNEWVESVLCKVEKFEDVERRYSYKKPETQPQKIKYEMCLEIAKLLCAGTAITGDAEIKDLTEKLHQLKLRATTEVATIKYLAAPPSEPRMTKLAPIMAELFPKTRETIVQSYNMQVSDTEQWSLDVDAALLAEVQSQIDDTIRRDIRQCIITDYLRNELGKLDKLEKWSEEGGKLA